MKNWERQHPNRLWWWKIPDYTRPGAGYSNDRAVDVVACYNGVFVGIEFKIKKDDRAFPMNRIRDGQVKTLCDLEVAGGVGVIAIVVYKDKHDKCVYLIPIAEWNKEVKLTTDRKSIRIEEKFSAYRTAPRRVGSFVHWSMMLLERLADDKRKN